MKRTITDLTSNIDSYSALSAPLSIDPELDGGIKKDILQTLDNKARNKVLFLLASDPSSDSPVSDFGSDGEYFIKVGFPSLVFVKSSGTWNAVEKSNDMMFYFVGEDAVRNYYSLSNDLSEI